MDETTETSQPIWSPTPADIERANVTAFMRAIGLRSYDELHAWSVSNREAFWEATIKRLGICFQRPFSRVMDLSDGVERPQWLVDARLNLVESCFTAPADSPAIIHQPEGGELTTMSVGELESLTNRVAASLVNAGFKPGDALAMVMPMTATAVAIYLGIIKAGCVVVGIPDSFRPKEIATRLRLAKAVAVFTQDVMIRGGKELPLAANVAAAGATRTIVLNTSTWTDFLVAENQFVAVPRAPAEHLNILFSSGTTGDPKVIPWTQTTPIKCAADAHFHQDIHPGDVLVWPTNIGWMMGPWLIFASLINKATMGLYDGAPTGHDFGTFVQNAKATMLGVVPSLVKAWRKADCFHDLDWSAIKLFSSTGECSNADDMAWLMALAGGRPVIEYCGGTEIGGSYITGTVTRPCIPGTFNTPALGLDFEILDDARQPADNGEVFIRSPSVGLSTELLNHDHYAMYFADAPSGMRRHGDQIQRLENGYWRAHGRVDDTMNLGGIKVSSAEIERAVVGIPGVQEAAAIAVEAEGGGPSQLVIYTVCAPSQQIPRENLLAEMQQIIKRELNPLFKLHDIVLVEALPRTASNKVLHRALRDHYALKS
jgi:acetyl-CoA synthetase